MTSARQTSPPAGRPSSGAGHYLRDLTYGALDGAITTMAVVAGTAGAHMPPRVGITLGLANLLADGLSMGASNYLGLKSELEQTGASVAEETPWRHGLATIVAFVAVGALPLLGYVLGPLCGVPILSASTVLTAVALLATGAMRSPFVRRPAWRSAVEMLAVGALAGLAAYGVGTIASRVVG